jgi:hypothetical protein
MDTTDRGFVQHWLAVGPVLQQIEREELAKYSEADRLRDIQALLDVPIAPHPSNSSGLVEQQRLYQRWNT